MNKIAIKNYIVSRLAAWENGDIAWNVSNQFEVNYLESALENLDKNFDAVHAKLEGSNVSESDWVYWLSDYDAPEISNAWYD